jgi:hypothetical protein
VALAVGFLGTVVLERGRIRGQEAETRDVRASGT